MVAASTSAAQPKANTDTGYEYVPTAQPTPDTEYEYVPCPSLPRHRSQGSPSAARSVVIVGAGPAGCMADLCLTTYGFKVLHIDNRPETTQAGRAE